MTEHEKMIRTVKKPKFESGGLWVDKDYLPKQLKLDLLEKLKESHPEESQEKLLQFIDQCQFRIQITNESEQTGTKGEAKIELKNISRAANKLLQKISTLSESSISAINYTHRDASLVRHHELFVNVKLKIRDREFLDQIWNYLEDLQEISEYAATEIKASTGIKKSTEKSRAIAFHVIDAYRRLFGKNPPKSEGTWFVDFMGLLIAWPGLNTKAGIPLKCGHELLTGLVDSMFSDG